MQDNLYSEFFSIIGMLEQRKTAYAVVGGIAMAFHDQPRYTKDIDLLILPDSAEEVSQILVSLGYFESAEPWTFSNTNITLRRFMKTKGENYWFVDLLIGLESQHKVIVDRAIVDRDPEGDVRLARKEDIIWMKSFRNSDQDRVDISRLTNESNSTGDAGT